MLQKRDKVYLHQSASGSGMQLTKVLHSNEMPGRTINEKKFVCDVGTSYLGSVGPFTKNLKISHFLVQILQLLLDGP